MGHLTKSIQIAAPVEQVWEFITHTSRLTDWAAEEIRSPTDDAMTVGTRWIEKLHIAGAPLETAWTIQLITAPHELVFAGVSTGGGQAKGRHTLVAAGAGTLMTTDVEYSLPGALFGRMFDKLVMERRTEADIVAMLQRAKAYLEREA